MSRSAATAFLLRGQLIVGDGHMDDSDKLPRFNLEILRHRVVAGSALADVLSDELGKVGIRRYMLITMAGLSERYEELAGPQAIGKMAGRFVDVIPHVPEETVVAAVSTVRSCTADGLVVFGGGSSLDTAKAVSDRLRLPIVAIPTNFSGSEVTWNYGLTVDGVKQTMRNPAVLPSVVIYDYALLSTLPSAVAICSGINAVAHAIEALYAPQANPLTHSLAETGIRKMIGGLQANRDAHGMSLVAAASCLAGSWLCGEVLSQVGMGIHHRICHVLGGTFKLPHAEVHTVLLPYVIAWNYEASPALAALADLFPGKTLAQGLAEFAVRNGAPGALKAVGLRPDDIPKVAQLALASPVSSPRAASVPDIEAILTRAFSGELVIQKT
jgi:maleylacetate reductase